ncbi:MAG: phage head closure protein [Paraclostridium sp.]
MARIGFTKINIGDLREPIEIQSFEHSVDEYGFNTPIWKTIATPRAKVEFDDRQIRQVLRDDGVDATTSSIFTIRYNPLITTKDRIIYKKEEYEIYAKQDLGGAQRLLSMWGRKIEPTD